MSRTLSPLSYGPIILQVGREPAFKEPLRTALPAVR
jgi:hypothetical protein